jgi:release factor glutamine methyltransferase
VSASLSAALEEGRARLAAAGIETAELEARLLLGHATGLEPAALIARGRDTVEAAASGRYAELLSARSRRVPLAYLTGEREFWSLRLQVDRRVLIPRPETETLVEAALERLQPGARIADIGTGSGAVVIALATELGDGEFFAVDRSADALEVARANAAAHGLSGRIRFLEGDLLAPLAGRAVTLDAIVANLPYVPAGEMEGLQPEVRDHEPRLALDGGADGLAVIERIVAVAQPLLRPGGWLLLEVGAGQAPRVRELLERAGGWEPEALRRDLAGIERVVAARRAT